MTAPAKDKTATVVHLPCDIAGLGQKGDAFVHDPDHPNPRFRYSCVHPVDPTRKQEIIEALERAVAAQKEDMAKEEEVAP